MEYVIGIWLVGVVLTSLFVIARLRGEVYSDWREITGTIACVLLVSTFWFISMPYLAYELNKIKKKSITSLLNDVRSQDERK